MKFLNIKDFTDKYIVTRTSPSYTKKIWMQNIKLLNVLLPIDTLL